MQVNERSARLLHADDGRAIRLRRDALAVEGTEDGARSRVAACLGVASVLHPARERALAKVAGIFSVR